MHLAHDTISPTTGMSEITEDIWSQSHTHETTSHAQAICVKTYCSYIVQEHESIPTNCLNHTRNPLRWLKHFTECALEAVPRK